MTTAANAYGTIFRHGNWAVTCDPRFGVHIEHVVHAYSIPLYAIRDAVAGFDWVSYMAGKKWVDDTELQGFSAALEFTKGLS